MQNQRYYSEDYKTGQSVAALMNTEIKKNFQTGSANIVQEINDTISNKTFCLVGTREHILGDVKLLTIEIYDKLSPNSHPEKNKILNITLHWIYGAALIAYNQCMADYCPSTLQ